MTITVKKEKLDGVFDLDNHDEFCKTVGATLSAFNVIGNRVRVITDGENLEKSQSLIKKVLLDFRASGTTIDVKDFPQNFPLLSVVALFSCSDTTLKNACEYKNVKTLIDNICLLGGDAIFDGKDVKIKGRAGVKGYEAVSADDENILIAFILSSPFMDTLPKIHCEKKTFNKVKPYLTGLKPCGLQYETEE